MTGSGQAVLVIVLVAVASGLASVFRQVQAALLPWLARTPDELTGANTAASMVQSAAMIGGPVVAAGLLAVGTAQDAMLAACGLVASGAVLLTGVRPLSSEVPPPAARPVKQLRLDLAAGWQAGIRRPGVRALAIPATAQTFGRGVLNVLTVIIALDLFGLGQAGVGWLGALPGLGRPDQRSARPPTRPGQEGGPLLRRRGRGLGSADDPAGIRPRPVSAVADVRIHRVGQRRRRRRGLQRSAAGDPASLDGARDGSATGRATAVHGARLGGHAGADPCLGNPRHAPSHRPAAGRGRRFVRAQSYGHRPQDRSPRPRFCVAAAGAVLRPARLRESSTWPANCSRRPTSPGTLSSGKGNPANTSTSSHNVRSASARLASSSARWARVTGSGRSPCCDRYPGRRPLPRSLASRSGSWLVRSSWPP
jgi:hypothetical protein